MSRWVVKTRPCWLIRWGCGCVKAECACTPRHVERVQAMRTVGRKREFRLHTERCPDHAR